jgi:hypothetical protein
MLELELLEDIDAIEPTLDPEPTLHAEPLHA